jgi:hypothetical protein
METEVVNLGKEIERLERQAALDLELANPSHRPSPISLARLSKVKRPAGRPTHI